MSPKRPLNRTALGAAYFGGRLTWLYTAFDAAWYSLCNCLYRPQADSPQLASICGCAAQIGATGATKRRRK